MDSMRERISQVEMMGVNEGRAQYRFWRGGEMRESGADDEADIAC